MRSIARIVTITALMFALTHASTAFASVWPMPVSGGTPTLGFGVSYAGGTHRGVDLEAAAGAEVVSPVGGTVTFAGRVPADGGGTCAAVTIELPDGRRVSMLPLECVSVASGDDVGVGDAVGTLAATGDDSTDRPHLHVGLRTGELYIDPAPFLPCDGGVAVEVGPESSPIVVPDPPSGAGVDAAAAGAVTAVAAAPVATPVSTPAAAAGLVEAQAIPPTEVADVAPPVTGDAQEIDAIDGFREAPTPNTATNTVRKGVRMPASAARPVLSGVLALGMLATGIAIVRVRRAAPVRVR